MGFRASDIVSIRFQDINWKKRSITIIQQKTGKLLEMPMPVRTGNVLLAWLSVEDYAATQMELVVVSAMKGYLRRMPEKEAFKKVEAILDPKVIRLAGDDGAPMPVQSNVDGAKFAAFIDAAVADSIRELEKREDDLSKAGVTMLENVDGKSIVEQMSPQFLEFVLDAYRGLKYTR